MDGDFALSSYPEEWEFTTLGELLDKTGGSVQTGPFGSQLHAADYVDEGIPSVMPKNISIEGIVETDIARIMEDDAERLSKYLLMAGDVIYSRRGDVEKCALVKTKETGWLCGTGCLRVRLGARSKVSPEFLHSYLSSPAIREWISRNAIGATMPNLNTSILRNVPLLVPESGEINFIANNWKLLNEKIQLNRQINQTLEQMAQALFKSWFVDFDPVIDNAIEAGNPIPEPILAKAAARKAQHQQAANQPPSDSAKPTTAGLPKDLRALFPSEFEHTEELGWVPKGWELCDFGQVAEHVRDNVKPEDIAENDCYVGLEHFTRKHIFLSNLGRGSDVDSNKSAFQKDDLLFGKLRPYFHKVAIAPTSGICSTDILVFRSKTEELTSFLYLTAFSTEFVEYSNLRSTGTRMPRASAKDMLAYKLVKPGSEVLVLFEKLVKPFWDKGSNALKEIAGLEKLRDTLLPKLISGELRIPDAEQAVEALS